MRPARCNAARAAMLAVGLLLIVAGSAQATVGVEINADTLVVTGSTGNDVPQFDTTTSGGQGKIRVFDPDGVVGALPAGCDRDDPDPIQQDEADVAVCPAGSLAQPGRRSRGRKRRPVLRDLYDDHRGRPGRRHRTTRAPPGCSAATTFAVGSGAGQDHVSADSGTLSSIQAELGAGDDTFNGGDGDDIAHGGEGHDYLTASAGNDQHFGEGGNDDIMGGPGNDVEDGGPGDDRIGYSAGIRDNDDDQGARHATSAAMGPTSCGSTRTPAE